MLPALTLTLRPLAYFTQVTRAAMAEVLRAPYITAARSRGLGMHGTVMRHGIRNGSLPIVTFFALWLAGLLGGSVVVEVIFAIPEWAGFFTTPWSIGTSPCCRAVSSASSPFHPDQYPADGLYVLINPAMRGQHDH